MKANLENENRPMALVKLKKKETEFPMKIPISFNNLNLGNIIIDFEQDFKERVTLKKNFEKMNLILVLLDELIVFSPFLKKDIELRFKMREKAKQMQEYLVFLSTYSYYGPKREISRFRPYDFFIKDKEIFDLVKYEGPISLVCSCIQMRIAEWLFYKEVFGRKMNQLFQSLKEYAYGRKLLPLGRSRIEMVKKIGREGVKEMHKDITSILGMVKKNKKRHNSDTIYDSIERAGNEFLIDLEETWTRLGQKMNKKLFLKVVTYNWIYGLQEAHGKKYLSFISECIENDELLRTIFYSFNWEPNKLALDIMAKLLDTKPETIRSEIYRSKDIS